MDDTFSDKAQESAAYFSQVVDSLGLVELFLLFHQFFKISVAQFLNNVVKTGAFHDIIKGNDIGRFEIFEDLDLSEDG
jgi:hypothetical protein